MDYSTFISQRINEITESATLGMTKLARQLKEEGKDIISLSIGEPDFDTPQNICKAAYDATLKGYTHYPPVLGLIEFRQAIIKKLQSENNLNYSLNEIIVSTGAKHSIINAVMSIINPDDEVLLPAPFWVSYPTMVEYAKGKVVPIYTNIENDYKPTAEQIEAAITPKTKLLIFSNPTNPSGSVWNETELKDIAKMLEKYPNILILSDEIYEKINYTNAYTSFAALPNMFNRTATVNGLAKGYAMTGWRIGYMAAPEWWVAACEKYQGLFTSGANSVAQMAGVEALLNTEEEVIKMRDVFKERKQVVYDLLRKIPGLKVNNPEGAFYFFPDVSYYFGKSYNNKTIENASDLCMFMLEHAQVAMVSGEPFGAANSIRLSYATSLQNLQTACLRLIEAFKLLQ